MTPVWERAAREGDTATLSTELAAGADVNALDRYGQSALMLAALHGHHEAIQLLIRAGAALDVTAKFRLSATMLAVVNGHEAVARALAAAGADLTLTGAGAPGFAGKTAAQLAVDRGLESLAEALSTDDRGTMEARITLITIGVSDLPRAVRFYRDGLGWPTSYEEGGPVAFFVTAGTRLSLYPLAHLAADISADVRPERVGFGGITLAHNVRTRAEVAEVLALAEQAGGRIVKPAQDAFWGGHSGYFTDPDGYYWEVAWNPRLPLDANGFMNLTP